MGHGGSSRDRNISIENDSLGKGLVLNMFDSGIVPIFDLQIPFQNSQDIPLYIIFEPHSHVFILSKSDRGFIRVYSDKPQKSPVSILVEGNKISVYWHESVSVDFYRNDEFIEPYTDELPIDF